MTTDDLKEKVLELIRDYLNRPEVQGSQTANQVLNCLAGDIEVLDLSAE